MNWSTTTTSTSSGASTAPTLQTTQTPQTLVAGGGEDTASGWSWASYGNESGFGGETFGAAGGEEDESHTRTSESSKDAVVLLIDCSAPMFVPVEAPKDGGGESDSDEEEEDDMGGPEMPYKNALKIAKYLVEDKIISSPGDLVGVCLYATNTSQNASGFKSIHMLVELDNPDASMIETLETELARDIKPGGEGFPYGCAENFPFSQALWACQAIYQGIPKVGTKRVWIFTNNDNPNPTDVNQRRSARVRADDLAQLKVEIDLFAFNLPPSLSSVPFDVTKFFLEIIWVNEDSDTGVPDVNALSKFAEVKNYVRRKIFPKRSAASVPWTLFGNTQIGIKIYNQVVKATRGTHSWLEASSNAPVASKTSWICEETGTALLPSQIKTVYPFGNVKVPITKEEIATMKQMGDPSLVLMGFKPISALKKHYNIKHGQFIYPDDEQMAGSRRAFAALHDRMLAKNRMAICRLTAQSRSAPMFVALVPQAEERDPDSGQMTKPPGMHLVFLPYADDIRDLKIPGADNPPPTSDQVAAAKTMVQALQIEEFSPDLFSDPALQKHYTALQSMALQRDEMDTVVDHVMPDEEAMEDFEEEFTGFKSAVYPEDFVVPKKAPTKKRGRDDTGSSSSAKKKQKKLPATPVDWLRLAQEGSLKKVTVAQLKDYLASEGVSLGGKSRKADLIALVNSHLGF